MSKHETTAAPVEDAPANMHTDAAPVAPVVVDQGSKGSPVDINDTPGRTTGEQIVEDVVHDVEAFVAALDDAVRRHVPHGVLRRLVELHEWARREAI